MAPLPSNLWFPVAPGVTDLPAAPAPSTAAAVPANAIATPSGFDAANPGAIWELLPVEEDPVFAATLSPVALVPVVAEEVKAVALIRLRLLARSFPYALSAALQQVVIAVALQVSAARVKLLKAEVGATAISGQDAGRSYTRKLSAAAGNFAATGFGAGSIRDYRIGTNYGTFTASGQNAIVALQRAPLAADAGSFALSGQAALLSGATSFPAEAGSFAFTGQDAGSVRSYVLSGGAGSLSLAGQPASLGLPDPYFSNVVLLLHMNGTDGSTSFVDSSSSAKTVTAYGGASISTAQSKFNGSSGSFDGANTYLLVDDSPDWYLGSGEFTIEAFIRLTSQATTATIASQRGTDSNNHAWSFTASNASGGQLQFRYTTGGSSVVVRNPTWVPTLNTWYHVCVCRAAGNLRLFVDGVVINSGANGVDIFNSPKPLMIGAGNNNITLTVPINFLNGYIQDLRITKGVGRYTGNFTVPSQPFPDF